MPRDLELEKSAKEDMPPIYRDRDEGEVSSLPDYDPVPMYRMPSTRLDERFLKMKDLHPYVLLLNQDDADDCDWLEHTAFDPNEAASREKVLHSIAFNVASRIPVVHDCIPPSPVTLSCLLPVLFFMLFAYHLWVSGNQAASVVTLIDCFQRSPPSNHILVFCASICPHFLSSPLSQRHLLSS